jgi:DNA integrity scanning protein DisA with diadenylate cyclase activity
MPLGTFTLFTLIGSLVWTAILITAGYVLADETPPGGVRRRPDRSSGRRSVPTAFATLVAVLSRHDLAVMVDADGVIRKVAVGLRWSPAAEQTIHNDRGMRHRSAQCYSFDRPAATVVVVSEDGPVTVYCAGEVVVTTGSGTR